MLIPASLLLPRPRLVLGLGQYGTCLQEYEMKLEEHSKVKEMIDGINQSNLQNLESFEEQIKQRNITIEALRTDIDEKRKRAERAENDLKVAVEQKERYRVEAQQAQRVDM